MIVEPARSPARRGLARPLRLLLGLVCVTAATGAGRAPICTNASGSANGMFHTFWRDAGTDCMTLTPGGYAVRWRLGARGNLVAGRGWAAGTPDRVVRYRARVFDPGINGYLGLYGWSRYPLVEYYVVENWGDFVPPGGDAMTLGEVRSDGGTYRIYRTRRIDQPSIAGRASFDQYWSVRTARRAVGADAAITFANHVAAWRAAGLILGKLDYQVLATEGFGSTGRSEVRMVRR